MCDFENVFDVIKMTTVNLLFQVQVLISIDNFLYRELHYNLDR